MDFREARDPLLGELQSLRKGRGVSLSKLNAATELSGALGLDDPQELLVRLRDLVTALGTDRSRPALLAAFNFGGALSGTLDARRDYVLQTSEAHRRITAPETVRADEDTLISEIVLFLRTKRDVKVPRNCLAIDLTYMNNRLFLGDFIAGPYATSASLIRNNRSYDSRGESVPLFVWQVAPTQPPTTEIRMLIRVMTFSHDGYQVTYNWRALRSGDLTELLTDSLHDHHLSEDSATGPREESGETDRHHDSVTRFGSAIEYTFARVRIGEYLAISWTPKDREHWLDQSEPSIANEDWGIGYPPYGPANL